MNYSNIKYNDIANGTGVRTSLFVSGCRLHCPYCFNSSAWDFHAGKPFTEQTEQKILKSLEPDWISGLTILGGDPFEPENQEGLVFFIEKVRHSFPTKTIWMFTGYLWEDLQIAGKKFTPFSLSILRNIDVLVDGPFIWKKKDISLQFRGSSNQRILDVKKSLHANAPILLDSKELE